MTNIRPKTLADQPAIHAVNKIAFGNRDAEPRLVEAIRQSDGFIPELSLVAVDDHQVVGHILFSRIQIVTKDG